MNEMKVEQRDKKLKETEYVFPEEWQRRNDKEILN